MNTFSLDTTQNIAIEYPLAGVGDRILANVIDWLCIIAYYFILIFAYNWMNIQFAWNNIFSIIIVVFFSLPLMFYNLAFEIWMNGQTLGKKARNIRVMSLQGGNASISQYFIRWLLRLVDIYIGYGVVAFIAVAASDKNQRLGDIAAGTIVVKIKEKETIENTLEQLQAMSVDYEAQFPEVVNLDYADIRLLKDVINTVNMTNNSMLALELSNKIEQKIGIQRGHMDPMQFLHILLNDYTHTH